MERITSLLARLPVLTSQPKSLGNLHLLVTILFAGPDGLWMRVTSRVADPTRHTPGIPKNHVFLQRQTLCVSLAVSDRSGKARWPTMLPPGSR